ncbi:4-dihydrotrisporin dehydrogenase [Blakeslea trispora]|nr:4-dihydrotrisporin dehydrogenase [Blakeslea trispora]
MSGKALTYLITGSSRGIGLEFVRQLAGSGHKVFASARQPEQSEALKSLINDDSVFGVPLDVTDSKSIEEAVFQVSKDAPEGIDVLINNAGIGGHGSRTVFETPEEDFLNKFRTNTLGAANVTNAFLPLLRQGETRKIMNMSTVLASIQSRGPDNKIKSAVAFSVSKAALNMLTRLTASQLASEDFIVYASHPGWVKTDFGGINATMSPERSVKAQLQVLENLKLEDNGKFLDFRGKEIPW